tara:strand:- start:68 stop:286 length:219 start_codon:yes stop_codon:yes gene_type:complete
MTEYNDEIEGVHTVCSICNDEKGKISGEYCRDNEKSEHYDDDLFGTTDYWDCWGFLNANKPKHSEDEPEIIQ